MDTKERRASEVIEEIQSLIDKHGDLNLSLRDPDTGWILPIEMEFSIADDGGEGLLITSSY